MNSHQTIRSPNFDKSSKMGLSLRQLPLSTPRDTEQQARSPSLGATAATGATSAPGAKGDGPLVASAPGCLCPSPGGFGVRVDLSALFTDERCVCWMWAEARRPVRWLAARLNERLHLPRPLARLALLAPLGLLHPNDPLALLCPGDTIRVIPLQSRLFRGHCCLAKERVDECSLACISVPRKDNQSQTNLNENYENDDESLCSTRGKACNTYKECKGCNYREECEGCNVRPDCEACNTHEVRKQGYCTCTLTLSPKERAAAAAEPGQESPLRAMKQCALALLNRLEHSVHSASPSPPPSPPPPPLPAPRALSRDHSRSRSRSPRSRSADVPDAGTARAGAGAGGGGGRPRRRRVRRRPRRPDPPPTPTTPHNIAPQVDTLPASASAFRDSSVVRNASTEPRALAPRRVHALAV